jgi:hypothetical protein
MMMTKVILQQGVANVALFTTALIYDHLKTPTLLIGFSLPVESPTSNLVPDFPRCKPRSILSYAGGDMFRQIN